MRDKTLGGKPVSRYFRLSKKEEKRDKYAVARQHFQLDQACRILGDDPPVEEYLFEDMQSGRNDDRPDFMKLVKVIERKETRCVVVTRLDRITRDLEMNARLAKLFQKTGVDIYTTLLGRCYDFNDPNDWKAFVNAGVDAEAESRMLSARILATGEFMRHMGKVCGGKTSLGFRRSADKTYEPDPETWELAREIVEKFLELESAILVSRWLESECKIQWSYQSLSRWLQNPLLRGHTAYFWKHDSRRPQKTVIKYNTHIPLIDLITSQRIDSIFADNRHRKDKHVGKVYSLSGLVKCAVCGANCTISYPRIVCANRRKGAPGTACGDLVNKFKGRNQFSSSPGIAANHDEVENYVIQQLCARGDQIAQEMSKEQIEQAKESVDIPTPEEIKVCEQVARLENLIADLGDQSGLLRQKIVEIKSKLPDKAPSKSKSEDIEFLSTAGRKPKYYERLKAKDRQLVFRRFVEHVLIDGTQINSIKMQPLPGLSDQ